MYKHHKIKAFCSPTLIRSTMLLKEETNLIILRVWLKMGLGVPDGQMAKNLPATQETCIHSLGREDPLEKGMATHSSILAWRISWTEENGIRRKELPPTWVMGEEHLRFFSCRLDKPQEELKIHSANILDYYRASKLSEVLKYSKVLTLVRGRGLVSLLCYKTKIYYKVKK